MKKMTMGAVVLALVTFVGVSFFASDLSKLGIEFTHLAHFN